ncbi:Predicted PurR-regulated permease PerM [Cognatiyoonia koreensis]|uniref:Predicted PurR-regulated permease PerM n=1 Tax=Cognatiyoonia koreensis TaxID=364200 RepID=A0A1I0PY66_9RHOB|nr:AI-2E family transporter [Cognatiyoonia koreensis]SEW19132.1 Predicted PurR-regulated permease PerM [Cognatiyoonia koreensis]
MTAKNTPNYALWLVAIIVTLAALDIAASLMAPIFLAVVLGIVLSPLTDFMRRGGIPPSVGALFSLMIILGLIGLLVFFLEPILTDIINRAPLIWLELRATITDAQATLRGIEEVSADMAEALNPDDAPDEDDAVRLPSVTDALLSAPGYAGRLMIFVGTLYFFLLARVEVYDWVTRSTLRLKAAHLVEAEKRVARYFLTITIINTTFGFLVGGVLLLLDMPYAPLWGFIAALVNFVLYLGPAVFVVALVTAGVVTFDGPYSFAPAIAYVLMNMTEGQFVTPALVGRTMSVNPLLVFLSLVLWLWLWGPVGGIIAIPLLIWAIAIKEQAEKI